ncbi:hypothetical protein PM082_001944 [Marasmius tenuissimus]|nr:hypothetical protein PM082_015535 [Marasmius tenuissimus]KAJ8077513.1 hypothetical protein PM082_001944 [Marasmius tenuissimus]
MKTPQPPRLVHTTYRRSLASITAPLRFYPCQSSPTRSPSELPPSKVLNRARVLVPYLSGNGVNQLPARHPQSGYSINSSLSDSSRSFASNLSISPSIHVLSFPIPPGLIAPRTPPLSSSHGAGVTDIKNAITPLRASRHRKQSPIVWFKDISMFPPSLITSSFGPTAKISRPVGGARSPPAWSCGSTGSWSSSHIGHFRFSHQY